ncbi:crossover junction endonuclease MUS81 isoform X2 [Hoplias malabaricus]|uniref:crossover junction endonuclease MUS81 isoform X2 n=1 Tax=Hoplias malabaricus TaxID=27720 RepID=UPI003462F807
MNPEPVRVGRKRPLPSCPNPLFLLWLTEMRDHAKEKGLKTQYVYQKAINSLKKYPLPLKNGKEAKILQNFGDGICKILDERLQRHYRENGVDASIQSLSRAPSLIPMSDTKLAPPKPQPASSKVLSKEAGANMVDGDVGKEKNRKKKEYVPQKRSGGYAVLLTLYRHSQVPGSKGFMFKNELQTEAQSLCEKSFTVPDLGSKYTAWSSVSTLIQKDLLLKTHNPASSQRERPKPAFSETQTEAVPPDTGLLETRHQALETVEAYLLPGSYDIVLCVDFIETTGGNTVRKQELVKELQKNGVNFDIRKLNVGDFLWIARENVTPVPGQLRPPVAKELVLDYIIERKRMDDLCGSIMDGRFREQKFRLKRCGLHKPIYLVEECGSAAAHLSLPESTLQQAIVNTQVVDGFFVKRVQDVKESAAYLTVMTRYLQKLYKNCTLFCHSRELEGDKNGDMENDVTKRERLRCSLLSFTEFNCGAVKNKCQTVRDVFARQLMQISGISGDKAAAILEHYSTVSSLLKAYAQCTTEAEGEKLLSTIKYGKLKRNLGPALSRTVYQLYCTRGALS